MLTQVWVYTLSGCFACFVLSFDARWLICTKSCVLLHRHEIVGIVTAVGSKVKNFKVGDRAGVGCLVDSCNKCEQCTQHKEEQMCQKAVQTYNMKGFGKVF